MRFRRHHNNVGKYQVKSGLVVQQVNEMAKRMLNKLCIHFGTTQEVNPADSCTREECFSFQFCTGKNSKFIDPNNKKGRW